MFIAPSENDWKTIPVQINQWNMRFILAVWKQGCFGSTKEAQKYHIFCDIFKVCIFHKKTVTCTRSPLTERMTYPEMFYKNLEVSHDQISKYFLCSTVRSNQAASTWASSAAKNQPRESSQSKLTFSLASVDMFNYSFLIFFARVTLNIVKLDQQFIR